MSSHTAFLDCRLDGLRWASCLRAAPPPSPLVPKAEALLLQGRVCGSRTVPGMVFPLSGGPAWGAYPRARAALAHVTPLVTLSVCCKMCPEIVCDPSAACLCACAATRSASLLCNPIATCLHAFTGAGRICGDRKKPLEGVWPNCDLHVHGRDGYSAGTRQKVGALPWWCGGASLQHLPCIYAETDFGLAAEVDKQVETNTMHWQVHKTAPHTAPRI